MRMTRVFAGLFVLLLLFSVPAVEAREVLQGDQCKIAPTETVNNDLFVLCRTLVIDGRVRGNLLGAATTAEINGTVDGDVYLLAGQLTVSGRLGGSLHFVGPAMEITASGGLDDPSGDLLTASLSTTLAAGAQIPNSVISAGYQLVLDGAVGGEVNFWGSALQIDGAVSGDVSADVGDSQSTGVTELQTFLTLLPIDLTLVRPGLRVGQSASIDGRLSYSAPSEGIIEANLENTPVYTPVIVQPDLAQITAITEPEDASRELGIFLRQVLREFVSLALVGALALLVTPGAMQALLRSLTARPLPSLGLGLLTFIASFPVLVILALLSLLVVFALGLLQLGDITLAGAALLGVANVSFASAFYFIAIFVARALACLGLGRLIFRLLRSRTGANVSVYIELLVGCFLLAFLFSLPVIGWLISALSAFLGLGAILTYLQGYFDARRRLSTLRVATPVRLPSRSEDARHYPPPMLDSGSYGLGMDNLPDGFHWWGED
ncbi:MAG: polymer-forming cytoskeletal protein [Anaerolineae bacterium]|nr:polymer-forming cytoskeletal protein [Anaerolineae bacterium]